MLLKRRKLSRSAIVLVFLAVAASPTLAAGWPGGQSEWGMAGGVATGSVLHVERVATHFSQAILSWTLHIRPVGRGWYEGNPGLTIEAVPFFQIDQRPHAVAGGMNVLLRYTLGGRRWRPALVGGAGMLSGDTEIPPGESRFNFTPQLGFGIQYLTHQRVAVNFGYRFHHISNAGMTDDNPGINSHMLLFGVSFF